MAVNSASGCEAGAPRGLLNDLAWFGLGPEVLDGMPRPITYSNFRIPFKVLKKVNAINVKRSQLLEKLKANRAEHRKIFLEAQEGYRAQCIKELDAMLQEARDGKRIRRAVALVEPMDQTWEYDSAIAMLEMSVDEVISLEEHDFKCYVLDQWQWKKQWTTSNVGYSRTLMAQGG